jgi:hypothetical protein
MYFRLLFLLVFQIQAYGVLFLLPSMSVVLKILAYCNVGLVTGFIGPILIQLVTAIFKLLSHTD